MVNTALDISQLKTAFDKYEKPQGLAIAYGTAGFRYKADILESTMMRCGVLGGLRSMFTRKVCGAMITASHNAEPDNGIKLIDANGEMLESSWEEYATRLANAETSDAAVKVVIDIMEKESIKYAATTVVLAHDTRPSGPKLVKAFCIGVEALGCTTWDLKEQTTPMAHFRVADVNMNDGKGGEEATYFKVLADAFLALVKGTPREAVLGPLYVDCANGVGAKHMPTLLGLIKDEVEVKLLNDVYGEAATGLLNHKVGADFVQKEKVLPRSFDTVPDRARCASMDGDADRLVYFTKDQGRFLLLDGDRLIVLVARLIKEKLPNLLASQGVKVGVVQTAYANGASTRYLEQEVGLPVVCTKTGVKHLHHEAKEFDIGIYFEANGHGTVLIKPELVEKLKTLPSDAEVDLLLALAAVMNQYVGDAFSCILMVEACLRCLNISIDDWLSLYAELPSKMDKVVVPDRNAVQTTDAERQCTAPAGLQEAINKAVAKYTSSRAFIRPSGTEDIVRVFAEADTQDAADQLAADVQRLVEEYCKA